MSPADPTMLSDEEIDNVIYWSEVYSPGKPDTMCLMALEIKSRRAAERRREQCTGSFKHDEFASCPVHDR